MKKRILIFSLAYYPHYVSGAEAAIREITDRIDDIEFEMLTLLFETTGPREEKIGNVLVHRIGIGSLYLSKILFVPLAALTALRLHRARPYDGLWAMMTYMLMPLTLARWLGVRVPYALTLQDGDPYEKVFERWFIRPVLPLIDAGFRNATVVQAISSYLASWPLRRGSKAPAIKIYNGGNPNDFALPPMDPAERLKERRTYGINDEDVLLGNTARLVYQKGWESTIEALTLLPEHVKLMVVGEGPDRTKYDALVKEKGLETRVIFAGHVDRSMVTKFRRMLDIFVMPSRSEGLGNAGISAMASRIPVIATQVGGLAEYIFDAKRNPDRPATAWAVDPDAPGQIAEAVQDIIAHPDVVKATSERAHAFVSENFQWDAIARQMRTKVFDTLL